MKDFDHLRKAYEEFDQALARAVRHSATRQTPTCPTCSKGCAACCYEPVYAERTEAEYALHGLSTAELARLKPRTHQWLTLVKPLLHLQMPPVMDYRALRAPCPFLADDHSCSIYDRRPTACRYHTAIGPPTNCHDDTRRVAQQFAVVPAIYERYWQRAVSKQKTSHTDHFGVHLAELLFSKTIPTAAALKVEFV